MKVLLIFVAAFISLPAFARYKATPFRADVFLPAGNQKAKDLFDLYLSEARAAGYSAQLASDGRALVLTVDAGSEHQMDQKRLYPNTLEIRALVSRRFDQLIAKLRPYLEFPDGDFCIGGACQTYVYKIAD